MKFACDSCATKYSIADERVKGRILKIRCKTCNQVITVREDMPGARPSEPKRAAAAPAPVLPHFQPLGMDESERTVISDGFGAPPPAAEPEEWYVSFDGEQEGPMALASALDRTRRERARGREAHAWRPGFFVWLPVDEVPEFAPALRTTTSPREVLRRPGVAMEAGPISVAKRSSGTGSRPAPARPSSSSAGSSAPVVRKDPTGPRAALAVAPAGNRSGQVSEDLHSFDGKPMPLPPPPSAEPVAPVPLETLAPAPAPTRPSQRGIPVVAAPQLTKPESAKARESRSGMRSEDIAMSPPLGAPAMTAAREAAKRDAAEKPLEEVSPFRAALVQAAEAAGRPAPPNPETGPVPLPPPPGRPDEALRFDEPSGFYAQGPHAKPAGLHVEAPQPIPRMRKRPLLDTFGGQLVTPPPNGAPASSPMLVVAGPVARGPAWHKWAALGGLVVSLALGVILILLVMHKAPLPPAPPVAHATLPKVERDSPIAIIDPPPVPPTAPPAAPIEAKRPSASSSRRSSSTSHAAKTEPSLTRSQRELASLYNDTNDHASAHNVPSVDRPSQGGAVTQQAIFNVVTTNRRSVNVCYERVLKHDPSLKRARIPVRVKVGVSGLVVEATVLDSQYAGAEIGQCITQAVKHWHFPALDSQYETEFPLLLQAAD